MRTTAIFGLLCLASVALAQERADPSIAVTDIQGKLQHPFQPARKASVIVFITNDCPISNRYAREIRRICEEFASSTACYLSYVDPDLTPQQAAKHMVDYGHGDYSAIIDRSHTLVKAAGATVTPEAVVVSAGGKIEYRGRIDNKYVTWGTARREATEFDLRAAIQAVAEGRPVATANTKPVGCFITPLDILKKK